MFSWEKLGKVFTPQAIPDRPWMKEYAQAPATLVLDDVVRVFFSCRPPADANCQYVSYSAFVDLDRADVSRVRQVSRQPVLALGGVGTFDEFGTYPLSVIRNGAELRGYYAGWTRCESVPFNTAIGVASSVDDGESFARLGPGPVLPYSPDEPFVMSGPKVRRYNDTWYLFYIAGRKWKREAVRPEPVYRIRMATSADGLNWTKMSRDLVQVRVEEDEAQASPDVFFANGKYHMFFCYRYSTDYCSRERGYRIGYASSTNLLDWVRDDARCGIDVSSQGWDSQSISYPHVFELDGVTYMAYLGDQVGRQGFGLARLQGDLA